MRELSHVQQFIDPFSSWQQPGCGQLCSGVPGQGPQQTVQLAVRLVLPVDLDQSLDEFGLLLVHQAAVGKTDVQCIAGIHPRAGEAQKQTQPASQARKEPARADIRMQADGDFRHRQPTIRCNDADRRALQEPHTAAHHVAMAPAGQGLRVMVQQVDEAVLVGKETLGQGRHRSGLVSAGLCKAAYVATGAERLGTVPA